MTRILLPALLLPGAAFAHTGDHSGAGWFHLLTEPDHLAMVAAAVGAVWLLRRWVRR
ncbi:hypothetical protein LHP98_06820 [Rhodobacter sp. Har01]|uniref:hypothetical protein n=1 Tax=Rhodobacter sp. Har01 TaxID=2883999 RepID=UPI001D05F38A|nr:hypothetical protein [Rhodobacter sp. Har01]MCB6177843.1 hypothetical protein [Rhodobacter sp. Har01]